MKSHYGQRLPHREFCSVCHEVSRVSFHVPDHTWKLAVHRSQQDSIMCVRCFTRMADERGVKWDDCIKFFPYDQISDSEVKQRANYKLNGSKK